MSNKEGGFKLIGLVMIFSLLIALLWDQISWLKDSIHAILNPTAGFLLEWNLTLGMLIIVLVISFLTTIVQKYATDQKALKELKKEQKILKEEMDKVKNHPEKYLALQKKQMAEMPETFKRTMTLSSRAMVYTAVPFILFFRWFNDYFTATGNPVFLGFMGWFVFYLITTLIFSGIIKKYMDVV
ncbi:MAG: DUF106 domain-containing protein [DPANN group archaeon]|nr:MAG: hypothetical protein QJ16_C0007G0063 [archaeon GW2011_AR1]MBS3064490.1 DUF106 domain-containing protein [DPANN group archaeon]OIO40863.1 MAG: hypothetical protein AUJ61_00940 [Candidatus Pacearchaeota archaeon CG1_02_30_18]PIN71622.1 MAG: hypothetical protein COV77_01015 [Candidatus Pacearchaeota archaeon CG11_big_fil_rev_8_21_14_0_20_30_13]PIZ81862.1 MAG: hypothetical protein COX98_02150 [Candidatus Pacearchaeota archaeon CG_4_10_14_0_2_um_filter_30_11]PJA71593.1 MAG: hypothetical pro